MKWFIIKSNMKAEVICILLLTFLCLLFSDTDEERTEAIFKKYEKEALEKGWKKKTLTVEKLERQLLWKACEGMWKNGAIIAFHGGGGTYSNYACGIRLGQPMVEFGELALKNGFAIICPDSTRGKVTDDKGNQCGKRWDCCPVDNRKNIDLPFIKKIIEEVIPELRPEGSSDRIFLTGISNGGFTTILAATEFHDKITAFAPVSCGDPYGTHMDMSTHPRVERKSAPGIFRDNSTGKPISVEGAAEAEMYTNEKPWPKPRIKVLPRFKQFQHKYDGVVDFSLCTKAQKQLVENGYRDAGPFIIKVGKKSVWNHFWLRAYNKPLIEFFIQESKSKN